MARLVFLLTEDVFGPSATLVAAYGNTGRVQWHVDLDDEWADESLVSDHLAAAAHWCTDIFPPADDVEDTYQLDLDA